MKKLCFITFVVSCLLILSLTSCGNFTSQNTGSIYIQLPGASVARNAYSGPTDDDKAAGSYTVTIWNENTNIERTVPGGEALFIGDLLPGTYNVKIWAHVGYGYYSGETETQVIVNADETTDASIALYQYQRFVPGEASAAGASFWITRQPDDSDYTDCFLVEGNSGIWVTLNQDRRDLNYEHWTGIWPFARTGQEDFCIGGTFQGVWHDHSSSKCPVTIENDRLVGQVPLPDLIETNYYEHAYTNDNQGKLNIRMVWDQDALIEWASSCAALGDMWCKLEIWKGSFLSPNPEDPAVRVSGTHFKCDSDEFRAFVSDGGLDLVDGAVTLYENYSCQDLYNALHERQWFIRCSLFFMTDENATYRIEFPLCSSEQA